jgi:GT2 family glycosyltransferase
MEVFMEDLVISIGTLDNYHTLAKCLHSIYREDSSHLSYQVWVIYNGSGDESITERIEQNFPQAKLIKRKGPLGFCATHNIVLSQCKGRYILILDDDTIVQKETLSSMVFFMDTHPKVGIAGCKTLNPDGTFQKTYGLLPSLKAEFLHIFKPSSFWPNRLYKDISSVREVGWLNGCFMLIRYEVLKEVGLLDEHYYTYSCEADWCYRIQKAGWQVVYVPNAEIIHTGGEHSINTNNTVKTYSNLLRYHVNRYYFFYKHYHRFAFFLLRPVMILGASSRVAYFSLIYSLKPNMRLLAISRLKAFLGVIKISFSSKPYNLPKGLEN